MSNKAVEKRINEIYMRVFNKVYNSTRLSALSKGSRSDIIHASVRLESSAAYTKFAEKFSKELAKQGLSTSRGVWRKYYEAARKLHFVALPKTWREYEAQQLSKAVKHNFELIKSIPQKTLSIMEHKYTSTLIEEVAKGKLTRGSFRRELISHGHKNAGVIARTETAKLQTAILENRAKDIGSVAYTWLSSNDKRTRQSHKDMNNVVVFWRQGIQKPLLDKMYGNAGEFPNCRCSPQPIVDIDDLNKSVYKVYDYTSHTIKNMTKMALIKALQKGEL